MTTLLDRYELGDQLGSGGAARVVLARDQKLGVSRAVKLIAGHSGAGREALRARLRREARAMAQLDHPNVLRIYDVGHDDGQDFVVMDLADGGSLADWLKQRGPMDPHVAIPFVVQVLAALAAAHAAGIVHRDVKPQNILLDKNGKALLADFGIAILDDDQRTTRTGMAMGSVAYMAPEQRLDARSVGRSADIYATGATLYHLLTRANPVDLFTAELDSTRFGGLPAGLREIVHRATRLNPEDRYDQAREMARDLLSVLSDEATLATLDPTLFPEPAEEMGGSYEPTLGTLPPHPSSEATQGAITFLGDDFELFRERLEHDLRGAGLTEMPAMDTLVPDGDTLAEPAPSPPPSRAPWIALGLVAVGVVAFLAWPEPYVEPAPITPTVLAEPVYEPGILAERVDTVETASAPVARGAPFGAWRFTMNGRSHDLAVRGTPQATTATWTSNIGAGAATALEGSYEGGVLTLRSDDGDVFALTFDGDTFAGRLSGVRSADVLNGRRP